MDRGTNLLGDGLPGPDDIAGGNGVPVSNNGGGVGGIPVPPVTQTQTDAEEVNATDGTPNASTIRRQGASPSQPDGIATPGTNIGIYLGASTAAATTGAATIQPTVVQNPSVTTTSGFRRAVGACSR